jgi:hypothetical protein
VVRNKNLGEATRDELAKITGSASGWGKYSTRDVPSPSGDFQTHFYRNSTTGDIYYGRDYKAVFNHQGLWNVKPSPNFIYEPSHFIP